MNLQLKKVIEKLINTTPIGKIDMYAGSTAPKEWLLCNGQPVSRTTYKALFNIIGTTYGAGDGSTTFNLPDLRNRVPVGAGDSYALNANGGTAIETFTDAQLAHGHGFTQPTVDGGSHSHPGYWGRSTYGGGSGGAMVWWDVGGSRYGTGAEGGHTHSVSGGSVSNLHGASSSRTTHDNRMPYRGINFIIYVGVVE